MKTAGRLFFGLFLALGLPFLAFGQDCLPNGDMNGDAFLSAADAIALINCALGGFSPVPRCQRGISIAMAGGTFQM